MKDKNAVRTIPEGWETKSLRHLGRFRKGLTITKADLLDEGIPCLNYGEVHSRYPFEVNQDVQPLKCVDPAYNETNPDASVRSGDFVFADTSEDLEGVGNFTLVTGESRLFAGYHTIIYSLSSEVNPRFLAYSLNSFPFRTQLRLSVKGIKVFSITQEILRGARVLLPPMDQQQSIAKFLDEESARIDTLIAKKTRFIELLKEKRQAVITKAVTKGLDDSVEMKDSGVEWIGLVPEHWDIGRLDGVSRIVRGNTGFSKDDLLENGHYVALQYGRTYKVNEINDSFVSYVNKEFFKPNQVAEMGDTILISTSETLEDLGHSCFYNREDIGLIGGEQFLLKPSKEKAVGKYLYFASKVFSRFLQKNATGLKVFRFGSDDLKTVYLPIPSQDEQQKIVDFLDRETLRIDTVITKTQRSIELLKEKRSALITAAVTGKIDLREAA